MLAMVLDPVLCVLRNKICFCGKHSASITAADKRSVVLTYLFLVRKRKKQNYWTMGKLQNSCFFCCCRCFFLFFIKIGSDWLFCILDHGLEDITRWREENIFISSSHRVMFFLLYRRKDIDKIIDGNYRNYVIDKLTC